MWRNGCRNEDNLIQAKILSDLLCSSEMAQMDGIKGSSKEPDLSLTGCGFFFYRLSPFGFRFLFFKNHGWLEDWVRYIQYFLLVFQ